MDASRRGMLGAAAFGFGAAVASRAEAQEAARPAARPQALGGLGLDAATLGLRAGSADDQSQALSNALIEASRRQAPLVIPPGRYRVSNVVLPEGARVIGVPGATQLVPAQRGPQLVAKRGARAALTGLVIDGLGLRSGASGREGLVAAEDVAQLDIQDCDFIGAGSMGLLLTRCGGSITRSRFLRIADTGLFSIDSRGLMIESNTVEDCGNNGIQLWRTQTGDDGSTVRGNRIRRIRSDAGGNGPNGNGIVTFRAGGVIIEGNALRDCALTFLRNNAGPNVQMLGNSGLTCGEAGIYSEFSFESAVIAGNVLDGMAQGINITNLDQGGRLAVCANNIVRRVRRNQPPGFTQVIGGSGIHIEAECAVTGNVVEDCEVYGLSLGWSWAMRNLAVTGNMVRNCRYGAQVSLLGKERNALIASNLFANCPGGAIVGAEWDKPVTGDLTKKPDPRMTGIRIEGNQVG